MAINIKAFIFVLIATFLSITFISSCSFLDDADVVRAPIPEDLVIKRERERREALGNAEDESFVENILKDITGFGNKDKSQNSGWNRSQYVPLESDIKYSFFHASCIR